MKRRFLLLSLLIVVLTSCHFGPQPPTETPTTEPIITPISEWLACPYLLPYPSSLGKIRVSQGNGGDTSHDPETYSEFAFDFDLEKGNPVYPARHGWVESIKNDSTTCGGRDKINDANYVIVRHKEKDESFTYSQYLHLQNNIPVIVGQEVWQNQTIIGYVGNTGYTDCGPEADKGYHLHFQVSDGPELDSQSMQICFSDVLGDGIPLEDGWYQSQNGPLLEVTISPPDIPATLTQSPTVVPSPKPPIIEGRWEGPVSQPSALIPYSTILILTDCRSLNSKCGTVEYPELYCSGEITFLYERNGVYHLLETITNDENGWCAPEVRLELELISGDSWNIIYSWQTKSGEIDTAQATLTKTE